MELELMASGLLPFELLTVRAADVRNPDAVELPPLVYEYDEDKRCWHGRATANIPRLQHPRWHHVYDAFDLGDAGGTGDDEAEEMLDNMGHSHVLLRIATEHPNDDGYEDM